MTGEANGRHSIEDAGRRETENFGYGESCHTVPPPYLPQ